MRVLERPTEPPPEGVELLRNEKNASGWIGVALVTKKYYCRWFDPSLKKTRAVPGLERDKPEDAAAALYEWLLA